MTVSLKSVYYFRTRSIIILCVIYVTVPLKSLCLLFQDSEYYNSMCYIRDNDPEPLDLYFSIEEDYFGEVSSRI